MGTVGNRIKECRIASRLTQDDVAKALGIGKQAVYKYEIGAVTNIPLQNLEIMARLFQVTPEYLAGWNSNEHRDNPSAATLSPDETVLIEGYRDLPDPGKQYMLQQLTAAKAIYGEKELPSSAASTSESC